MSFIERMIDKVDDPEKKKKGDSADGSDEQRSSFERLDEQSDGFATRSPPKDDDGYIPGIDGDLPLDELRAFEQDDGPVVDEAFPLAGDESLSPGPPRSFADAHSFADESAPDPIEEAPSTNVSPDMAFADALSRHEDLNWDDDDKAAALSEPVDDDIEWDTQPELFMPGSAPLDEDLPLVEPTAEKPSEDEELKDLASQIAVPEERSEVVDDAPDIETEPVTDEPVAEAFDEAQEEFVGEREEAVGDEIGLPPEIAKKRNVDDLDDFDDFDDFDDDLDEKPVSKPLPTALPAGRTSSVAERKRDPDDFDDFDDEDEDQPGEPRRVGNHVNLDLEHLADIGVITPDNARGKVAEEYRLIKRPLLLNIMGEGEMDVDNPNIIMVSSSLPGEGKTFTSVNLAMSMAMELDRTVLLVDADVAKPSFSRVFDMETEGGLIDVLLGDATLEEVLLTTNVPKLRLLPAGRRHLNSVELLASDHMKRLTNELSTRYENRIIVFDSPPLLATTEAGVLASLMSQIVLVVEANKTPQYVVQESLNILDRSKYIGLVLNKSRSSGRSSYYYDYRYPYYYGYGQ